MTQRVRARTNGVARGRGTRPEGEASAIALEAFNHFPYGILIVESDGSVRLANDSARDLLGDIVARRRPAVRCCDVFGCGRADGPFEGVCLTRLALEAGTRLPEVRVDVTSDGEAGSVWVTAAPTQSGVVFNMRPGDARDRRRRTEPHWIAGAKLRIFALGRTRVESAECALGGTWLQHRPGQLLKLLVAERHSVLHAEQIAEAFWPGAGLSGLGNVRHFIHVAREKLEPERPRRSPSAFIVSVNGGYALDLTHVRVDVDDFESRARTAMALHADGNTEPAAELLEQALVLWGGDFLADEPYAEWAFGERDRVRALAGQTLRTLCKIRLDRDDLAGATAPLERLAQLDRFDVPVQRQLIWLYLHRGRHSQALRHYETLRRRMLDTFDQMPDFELSDLVHERRPALAN